MTADAQIELYLLSESLISLANGITHCPNFAPMVAFWIRARGTCHADVDNQEHSR
jgi:hypothetical protein